MVSRTQRAMVSVFCFWVLVRGNSMWPSLLPHHLYVFCAAASPERGDIAVFRNGFAPDTLKVKRVAGVPGDTLAALDLPCPKRGFREPVIPAGRYYMLSDNLDAGFDSRTYGLIHATTIKGVLQEEIRCRDLKD